MGSDQPTRPGCPMQLTEISVSRRGGMDFGRSVMTEKLVQSSPNFVCTQSRTGSKSGVWDGNIGNHEHCFFLVFVQFSQFFNFLSIEKLNNAPLISVNNQLRCVFCLENVLHNTNPQPTEACAPPLFRMPRGSSEKTQPRFFKNTEQKRTMSWFSERKKMFPRDGPNIILAR